MWLKLLLKFIEMKISFKAAHCYNQQEQVSVLILEPECLSPLIPELTTEHSSENFQSIHSSSVCLQDLSQVILPIPFFTFHITDLYSNNFNSSEYWK